MFNKKRIQKNTKGKKNKQNRKTKRKLRGKGNTFSSAMSAVREKQRDKQRRIEEYKQLDKEDKHILFLKEQEEEGKDLNNYMVFNDQPPSLLGDRFDRLRDTPLTNASNLGYLKVVKFLLEKGVDVNKSNLRRESPLILATKNQDIDIIRLLVDGGANVNKVSGILETPLFIASRDGFLDGIYFLISKGADVNKSNTHGETPLHIAAKNGNKDVIRLLIEKGADVNQKDEKGNTPVDFENHKNDDIENFIIEAILRKGIREKSIKSAYAKKKGTKWENIYNKLMAENQEFKKVLLRKDNLRKEKLLKEAEEKRISRLDSDNRSYSPIFGEDTTKKIEKYIGGFQQRYQSDQVIEIPTNFQGRILTINRMGFQHDESNDEPITFSTLSNWSAPLRARVIFRDALFSSDSAPLEGRYYVLIVVQGQPGIPNDIIIYINMNDINSTLIPPLQEPTLTFDSDDDISGGKRKLTRKYKKKKKGKKTKQRRKRTNAR